MQQALNDIGAVLNRAGMSPSDVVSAQVYRTDGATFPRMNKVYMNYFKDPRPARDHGRGNHRSARATSKSRPQPGSEPNTGQKKESRTVMGNHSTGVDFEARTMGKPLPVSQEQP